jgi:hypothetical protein
MGYFAVVENKTILNLIAAESKEDAELILEKECIEFTLEDPLTMQHIWSDYHNKFMPPQPEQPFSSWTWDEDEYKWISPTAYPNDDKIYQWDEETLSWTEVIETEVVE